MKNQILWTACVTPFNQSGEKIDFKSFESLLKNQEAHQNGIVILGSTGEGLSLTESERQQLVHCAMNIDLKVPIIVGVPSANLLSALEWMHFCNELPIAGYLMATPLYTKPGIMGQTAWFKKLLNKSNHPCMLYNIPSRTGVKLYSEVVKNICTHDKFYAIKDSSGSIDMLMEYQNVSNQIALYCGDDYLMPAMATSGAMGLVSIASNVWPSATRQYVNRCLKQEKFRENIWWKASQLFTEASNPIPVKALLHQLGAIAHPTVRLPLATSDLPSLKALSSAHEIITEWERNHV